MSAGMGISAGTNVIGGVMKAFAAAMAQKAAYKEFQNERARQTGYANEAGSAVQHSLYNATADVARQQMEAGRANRLNAFSNVAQTHLLPGGGGGMNQVDNAKFGVLSKARANLGSYSDWALEQTLRDIKTQQELNRVINFAGGTASVFPYRQDAALHSQDVLALAGNTIQSLGGAGGDVAQYFSSQPSQQQSRQSSPNYGAPYLAPSNAPGWGEFYETEGRG